MNALIFLCILVLLPISAALNCYQCAFASRGCNDPFNATGVDVSTTGQNTSNTYCRKRVAVGVAIRTGETVCVDTKFVLQTGTTCCQTNLCNEAHKIYQIPMLLVLSLVTIFTNVQWI